MEELRERELEKSEQIMIAIAEEDSVNRIYKELKRRIKGTDKVYNSIDILCIGTDRSSGDSLGPMIGTFLTESGRLTGKCNIHGTLARNATNIRHIIEYLENKESLVIAVDACLGKLEDVGRVSIQSSALKPGLAVGKELGEVGDISIKGIINISGGFDFIVIQNTRLDLVYRMARVIEKAVILAIEDTYNEEDLYE